MNKRRLVNGVTCVSVLLATGAFAEILGVQPGTSKNPKDNVPTEIQRDDVSGGDKFPGGSGPGTRGNALTGGMEKEKSQPVTRQELEHNAEQGGGAAMAAEELKGKRVQKDKKARDTQHRESAAAREAEPDGPKENPKGFRQLESDPSVQGQPLINAQPMDKQQPANRSASERGASPY